MDQINLSIRKNTWIIILVAISFSFLFPSLGYSIKPQLNTLLIIMMFLSCLDLQLNQILSSLTDFKYMTLMLAIVHLVSPIIVLLLRGYFSDPVFLGLIIVTTIPAGRSAVFLSNIYGGAPIKALVSTSISNILSPIIVPLLVWTFAKTSIEINALQMSSTIFYLVIIPLVLALIVGKTSLGKKLNIYSPSISIVILFLIILGIISPLRDIVLGNIGLTIVLSLLSAILIIINFALGFLLGKNHSDHITYAISSSYKNYTLATFLSLSLFTPLVALPAIVYTVVSNLLLIPLQRLLQPPVPQKKSVHHRQKHQNISLFVASLIILYIFSKSPIFSNFFHLVDQFPYLAAIVSGILFASTFTAIAGGLIIIHLASFINPVALIILAGLGAVSCDAFMFLFFKKNISQEINHVYKELNHHDHFKKIAHTKYFAWTLPVIGAIIIASPLPDELGISLLGLSQTTTARFLIISLASHIFGISSVIIGSRFF